MSEFIKNLLQAAVIFLFGAGGLALINVAQERWKFKQQRKANKEDKIEEKEDQLKKIVEQLGEIKELQQADNKIMAARMEELEKQNVALKDGMKYVLLDRILHLGHSYIVSGEVSFDNRKRLGDMHNVYHNGLGGNGDADAVMQSVYELPLKN